MRSKSTFDVYRLERFLKWVTRANEGDSSRESSYIRLIRSASFRCSRMKRAVWRARVVMMQPGTAPLWRTWCTRRNEWGIPRARRASSGTVQVYTGCPSGLTSTPRLFPPFPTNPASIVSHRRFYAHLPSPRRLIGHDYRLYCEDKTTNVLFHGLTNEENLKRCAHTLGDIMSDRAKRYKYDLFKVTILKRYRVSVLHMYMRGI